MPSVVSVCIDVIHIHISCIHTSFAAVGIVSSRWHRVVLKANLQEWTRAVPVLTFVHLPVALERVSQETAPQLTRFPASKLPSPWK